MLTVGEYVNQICLFAVLCIAVVQDIKERKIKNVVNITGILLGVLLSFILPERKFTDALLGFVVMQIIGLLLWRLNVFRAGDAKLLCAAGAFTEWKMGLNILLISVIIGAVMGIPLVIKRLVKKEKGMTKFPFSIAIMTGALLGTNLGYLWEIVNFL